ncbi:MAG: signal transduction histidine kinase [Cellvibrionaceae bacterium]|jgi:signal transduction histidine kinase
MKRRTLLLPAITIIIALFLWIFTVFTIGEIPLWGMLLIILASVLIGQILPNYLTTNEPVELSEDNGSSKTDLTHRQVANLQKRLDELKMLRQFEEALSFTISLDAILWLIYTNCQEVVDGHNFRIYINDYQSEELYTAFYVDKGQRMPQFEGLGKKVLDGRVQNVIDIGQVWEYKDDENRFCLIAPLNSGADYVGAIQVSHPETEIPFSPEQYELFSRLSYQSANALDNWQTRDWLKIRANQMESLAEVIRTITAELTPENLLDLVLTKAVELLDVESGSFLLVDDDTGQLEFVAASGPVRNDLVGTRLPFGQGIAGQVAQTGEPKMVNDVSDTHTWFEGIDSKTLYKTESILTVPLKFNKTVLGVLQIINRKNEASFTKADQQLLSAFADAAVVALRNARLYQQTDVKLQERVQELSLLQKLDRDLNANIEMDATFGTILGWVKRLYSADAGAIILFTDEGEWLGDQEFGYDRSLSTLNYKQMTLPGLMGKVLKTGIPTLTGNAEEEELYHAFRRETRSQMILPITIKNQAAGIVSIERNAEDAFSQEDLQSATTLLNHCASSLANSRLFYGVQAANYAKSEFISIVSHELKNPLTSIKGYGDLLLSGLSGKMSDQQTDFVRTIQTNVKRMNRLIRDLTDVSRIDTGQLSVQPEPMPIGAVVSETIMTIQAVADKKNIAIHLDMLPDSPMVLGDQERLVQVMTNLMSNACKYSPENSNVYVSLTNGGNRIKLAVKDEGFGISKEDQGKLFTRFFRSDDPNVRQAPGTGLGLSISRAIVERHGGEMNFESILGQGTEFWFTIPLAD